jgi:hypothetical protein
MNPVSRGRNLDLLQLRRARACQLLCLFRQKSHLQSGTQPNHHAPRPPVVSRRHRSRHLRLQLPRPLIRLSELLLKSHVFVSIPRRDTLTPPATPPESVAPAAGKTRNSPQSPPAHPDSSAETSLHIHPPQHARAPAGGRSCKSVRPTLETPALWAWLV